jgi:hypothetical protein
MISEELACCINPQLGGPGSEREAGHHRHHREEKTTVIWPRQKAAKGENTKIDYGMDTGGEKMRTSKKNLDGRSTSSHDNRKFRTRSVEKQGGMAFGLWKMATAVIKPDIYIYIYVYVCVYIYIYIYTLVT